MKDDNYDDLLDYLNLELHKRSFAVRDGQEFPVNFSTRQLARDAYQFGNVRNYDLKATRQIIEGFLEDRFGRETAKSAIKSLDF
ncbi:MAG TPA: hypothetical protein VHA12_04445 [Candidatus Nanoarchaeia archaeon]|nr:hypothetical protein [Candidatus Nanoarchaeia archaeon]